MTNESIANYLLRWLGNNPAAYPQLDDKWPVIFADMLFYSIPVFFIVLFIFPFFWLWLKKRKLSLKNFGIAIVQSIGLIILGIIGLFFLYSFMLGQIAQQIN
ncbi:MAG: hypothetical protein CV087_11090 [Candidatus Brocadia sp. WS118]|nr:MAG: hypothetical protein CV087_11090 [Candidatus Brocadia sp. WS118]